MQSPLESTVEDFWRCIWENKIEMIAMLTKEIESKKVNFWSLQI